MPDAGDPVPCPTCRNPVPPTAAAFPFCGERCRDRDLASWFTGRYAVPAADDEADPS
jgi:endogenous inhibitor of DNA gyrase (YacG/DUF329 family)